MVTMISFYTVILFLHFLRITCFFCSLFVCLMLLLVTIVFGCAFLWMTTTNAAYELGIRRSMWCLTKSKSMQIGIDWPRALLKYPIYRILKFREITLRSLSLVMNRSSAIGELPQKLTRFINFRLYAFFTQGLFGEFYYWPNKEKNCSVGRFAAMSSISMRWKRFVTQFETFKLAKSFIVSETEWFVKLASFVLVLNWMLIGLLTTQIHFPTQF